MKFEFPKYTYNYPFLEEQTSYDDPVNRARPYTREHLIRLNGERQAIFNLLTHARNNGWHVKKVDNGEEGISCVGHGYNFIMEHVFSVDESRIVFQKNSKDCWCYIVLGNSPEEIVADWGCPRDDIEGFNDMMEEFHKEDD